MVGFFSGDMLKYCSFINSSGSPNGKFSIASLVQSWLLNSDRRFSILIVISRECD